MAAGVGRATVVRGGPPLRRHVRSSARHPHAAGATRTDPRRRCKTDKEVQRWDLTPRSKCGLRGWRAATPRACLRRVEGQAGGYCSSSRLARDGARTHPKYSLQDADFVAINCARGRRGPASRRGFMRTSTAADVITKTPPRASRRQRSRGTAVDATAHALQN